MIAEILSVGTELLMGQIANTDAQYISRRLSELGTRLSEITPRASRRRWQRHCRARIS